MSWCAEMQIRMQSDAMLFAGLTEASGVLQVLSTMTLTLHKKLPNQ
jgi:hypothetical protein